MYNPLRSNLLDKKIHRQGLICKAINELGNFDKTKYQNDIKNLQKEYWKIDAKIQALFSS